MKKLLVVFLALLILLIPSMNLTYGKEKLEDYGIEVISNYWYADSQIDGSVLYVPYLKVDVTNNTDEDMQKITVKAAFYDEEEKSLFSSETTYLQSSSDIPLKPGYSKTAFLKSSVGYTMQIPESFLPLITVDIYVNDVYAGNVEIERTFTANASSIILSEKEEDVAEDVEEAEEEEEEDSLESKLTISDGEIVFRNMAWGTSVTAFEAALSESGVDGSYNKTGASSWELKEDDGELTKVFSTSHEIGYVFTASPEGFKVAGVPVSKITAYFLFSGKDNKLNKSEKRASLYKAEYTFDLTNCETAYNDLVGKMNELYGNAETGQAVYDGYGGTETTDWAKWLGNNDTGAILYRYYKVDEGVYEKDTLVLSYGKTNSIDLINETLEYLSQEEIEKAESTGADGL